MAASGSGSMWGAPPARSAPAVEGLVEDASVRGPGVAAQRGADQRHDLHHGETRRGAASSRRATSASSGAHPVVSLRFTWVRTAVAPCSTRSSSTGHAVWSTSVGRAVGEPGRPRAHRAHQVGVGVGRHRPGAGLVEVGVGLDRRVEHDEAVAVDDLLPRVPGPGPGATSVTVPVDRVDAHVGLRPIGQSAADEEGHGTSNETPTLGRTSSASACSCSSICSRPSPGSSGNSTRWSRSSRSIHRPMWSATSS